MNCRQEHHSVKALHYLQHTLVVCLRQTMLIKPHGWIHYAQFHSQNRLGGAVTAESLRMAKLVNQCCKISLQLSNNPLIDNTLSETISSQCEWIRARIPVCEVSHSIDRATVVVAYLQCASCLPARLVTPIMIPAHTSFGRRKRVQLANNALTITICNNSSNPFLRAATAFKTRRTMLRLVLIPSPPPHDTFKLFTVCFHSRYSRT